MWYFHIQHPALWLYQWPYSHFICSQCGVLWVCSWLFACLQSVTASIGLVSGCSSLSLSPTHLHVSLFQAAYALTAWPETYGNAFTLWITFFFNVPAKQFISPKYHLSSAAVTTAKYCLLSRCWLHSDTDSSACEFSIRQVLQSKSPTISGLDSCGLPSWIPDLINWIVQ